MTPAEAKATGQSSIWRSACTPGDTSQAVQRRLISGHSPYEPIVGDSRAVVAGDRVHVAGTAPIPADGSPPPEDPYEQARLCLEIVEGPGAGHQVPLGEPLVIGRSQEAQLVLSDDQVSRRHARVSPRSADAFRSPGVARRSARLLPIPQSPTLNKLGFPFRGS